MYEIYAERNVTVTTQAPTKMITIAGRALPREELVRVIQFLGVGAYVALLNLDLVWTVSQLHILPYIVYVTLCTEVTICASFVLNDMLTFHNLKQGGHSRGIRLLRFHGSSALGALTTVGISAFCHQVIGMSPALAQFIALGSATVVNFGMHRFWTYRKPMVKDTTTPTLADVVTHPVEALTD